MFNCTECNYTSDRKLNLLSHTQRKHSRELKPEESINTKVLIIEVVEEVDEVVDKFKCEKCTKVIKSKQGLKYHIKVCKGVLNSLECHYCHKVLSHSSSKAKHIKTCKANKQQLIEKELKEVVPKKKTNIPKLLRKKYGINGLEKNMEFINVYVVKNIK